MKQKITLIFSMFVALLLFSMVAVYAATPVSTGDESFNQRLMTAEDHMLTSMMQSDWTHQAMIDKSLHRGTSYLNAVEYKPAGKVSEEDEQMMDMGLNKENILHNELLRDDTPVLDQNEHRAVSYVNALFYKPQHEQ